MFFSRTLRNGILTRRLIMGRRHLTQADVSVEGRVGKPNKPRNEEPSMFVALAWIDEERPDVSSGLARTEETEVVVPPPPPPPPRATPEPLFDTVEEPEPEPVPEPEPPKRKPITKKLPLLTRELPDSSLAALGKKTFHVFGRENVEPVSGGVVYGDYMRTHNVAAHDPASLQVYPSALSRKGIDVMVPEKRKVKKKKKAPRTIKPRQVEEPLPTPPPAPPTTTTSAAPRVPIAGLRTARDGSVAACLFVTAAA